MTKNNVDVLVDMILTGEWKDKVKAADDLVLQSSPQVVGALIELLKSDSHEVRDASALALREIGDNSAVCPLVEAIKKPEHIQSRSTLVYALETLDCSDLFLEIFKLALADKADVQMSAITILTEQGFYISDGDLKKAHQILKQAKGKISDENYKSALSYLNDLE